MMNFIVGVLVGAALCGFAAKGYVKQVVAEEVAKVKEEYGVFFKTVHTRLQAIHDKVMGK